MQFKVMKSRSAVTGDYRASDIVQCIRRQYDPERGERRPMVVAHANRTQGLTPEVARLLTAEERQQFDVWRAEDQPRFLHDEASHALADLVQPLQRAVAALREANRAGVDAELGSPERLWSDIEALARALKRAGYGPPARPRGRPRET